MSTRDHQFSVSSRCELLPYLLRIPLGLSRKQAKDLLRFRAVTVKRITTVRHDTQLEPGDVVTIAAGKRIPTASIERHGLKIIYLDDDIVVVDKRAGLLSMGSEGEKERTAHRILNDHLKALTKSSLQQAFIVHRLDRETSGLIMFARSRAIQAALQQTWKTVTKKYLAVVEGKSVG
jgi:23S rRNA-/tRNA-specific pseudouridylate synthase